MSLSFKSKFNEMQESNPTTIADQSSYYEQAASSRSICFVLKDGKKFFLNYNYLVSGEYVPEESAIILTFTSHSVKLKGIQLERLFDDFMQCLPKQIVCSDERYNVIERTNSVNDINIIKAMDR